jgi:hypothetical protein
MISISAIDDRSFTRRANDLARDQPEHQAQKNPYDHRHRELQLRIGELALGSNPAMPQKQIKDQDNEQNTAYADPATVAVTRIAETASKQEEQHDDYQDQIHWFPQVPQVAAGGHAAPSSFHLVTRSSPTPSFSTIHSMCRVARDAAFWSSRREGGPDRCAPRSCRADLSSADILYVSPSSGL